MIWPIYAGDFSLIYTLKVFFTHRDKPVGAPSVRIYFCIVKLPNEVAVQLWGIDETSIIPYDFGDIAPEAFMICNCAQDSNVVWAGGEENTIQTDKTISSQVFTCQA